MGVSTDGILFYGIAFEDALDLAEIAARHGLSEEEFDGDFDTIYAAAMGERPPGVVFGDSTEPLFDDHWERKRAIFAACPCEVHTYCSAGHPMHYVCLKEAHYVAKRGFTVAIPDGLTAKPEWAEKIRAYCEAVGLTYREPSWLLASYWG